MVLVITEKEEKEIAAYPEYNEITSSTDKTNQLKKCKDCNYFHQTPNGIYYCFIYRFKSDCIDINVECDRFRLKTTNQQDISLKQAKKHQKEIIKEIKTSLI